MSLLVWTPARQNAVRDTIGRHLRNAGCQVSYLQQTGQVEPPPVGEGRVCLAMGKDCLKILQKAKICAGNLGMGRLRQQPHQAPDGGTFFLSYSPDVVQYEAERLPEIQWDANLVGRYIQTGSVDPQVGEYEWVDDFAELCQAVHAQHVATGQPVRMSCDLETVGLNEWAPDAYIVSIGFSMEYGRAFLKHFGNSAEEQGQAREFYRQVQWLLTTPEVWIVGANFKYDGRWTRRRWGIRCTNQRFDTTLAGSLVNENRINTLNLHTKIYAPMLGGYDDPFNQTHDKSRMDLVPRDDLTVYAGGDLDAGLQVGDAIRTEILQDRRLANFYARLLHPASRAFETMEHRGMVVDLAEYEKVRGVLRTEIARAHGEVTALLPARMRNKYAEDLEIDPEDGTANVKPAIVMDFLFTPQGLNLKPPMKTPSGLPAVNKEALAMLDGHQVAGPFIKELKALRSVNKTMGTYVTGFLEFLRPDGRFHPSYILHRGDFDDEDAGSTTGRTACKDPAVNTTPKHTTWAKPLRRCFTAPPGHVILAADFSQGELRVTACVGNEPTMIAAYQQGIDLHKLTACTLNTLTLEQFAELPPDEQDLKRFYGKAGNFGLIYGMQPPGFMNYARTSYGVNLTLRESEDFREKFFGQYDRLPAWHESYIDIARRDRQVVSPLGRVRHLPLIHSRDWKVKSKQERRAINAPVQSTLTDMGLLAIAILAERYPELWVFAFTHDEIACYVPEDEVELWAHRVKEVMETLPLHDFGWKPQLAFPADLEFGPNLADKTEIKLAA